MSYMFEINNNQNKNLTFIVEKEIMILPWRREQCWPLYSYVTDTSSQRMGVLMFIGRTHLLSS